MSKLLVVHDGTRERELVLVERLVVGRDPACDISHEDVLLSRRHAEFVSSAGQVTVRDLGSRNGIFVNGTSAAEQALKPGDVVQIGPLRVRYAAERAPTRLMPEDLDSQATRVTSAADPAGPRAPSGLSLAINRALEPGADDDPGDETRVLSSPLAEPAAYQGTVVIPPPSRPPTVDAGRVRPPAPAAPASLRASEPDAAAIEAPSLAPFVFIQLATLVSVVFLSAAVPLIVWRGDVFALAGDRGPIAYLLWPVLPALVTSAATYWVGTALRARIEQSAAGDRRGAGRR